MAQAQQKVIDDPSLGDIFGASSCGLDNILTHARIALGELGVVRGPEEVRVDVLRDGEIFFIEHYQLGAEVVGSESLPLWLGGHSNRVAFDLLAQGRELEFSFHVGDRWVTSLGVDELLASSQRIKAASSSLASVAEMSSTYSETTVHPVDIRQKTFQCPNAFPQCDYEYDYCVDNCVWDPNSTQCLQQCDENFQECAFGAISFSTVKTLQSYSYGSTRCGNDPQNGGRHKWDVYNVVWRYDRYRNAYCRTNGQTYNLGLDSTWTENGTCYLDRVVTCSPINLVVSSSACIWRTQPGGP